MDAPQREFYQSNASDNTYNPDREAVCEAAPIEEVVRRYIPDLEPFGGGGWFTGTCPLPNHEDKDQSFYISPESTWECWGCDQRGDVVSLAVLCGDYGSPQHAITALAAEYGIELRYEPHATESLAWPALPNEALHGLAGDIVKTVEPHTEADLVAVLANTVVAFGNALGRGAFSRWVLTHTT